MAEALSVAALLLAAVLALLWERQARQVRRLRRRQEQQQKLHGRRLDALSAVADRHHALLGELALQQERLTRQMPGRRPN